MKKRNWIIAGVVVALPVALLHLQAGEQDNNLLPPKAATENAAPSAPAASLPSFTEPTPPVMPSATATPTLPVAPTIPLPATVLASYDMPGTSTLAPARDGSQVITSQALGFITRNDERHKEIQAAQAALVLASRIPENEEQRAEIRSAVKEKLNEVFDLQQSRRSDEIAAIEARLTKLKETLEKRKQAKETIVGRRLDQLVGGDELSWEESGDLVDRLNPALIDTLPQPTFAPPPTRDLPTPKPN